MHTFTVTLNMHAWMHSHMQPQVTRRIYEHENQNILLEQN